MAGVLMETITGTLVFHVTTVKISFLKKHF